jgi:hypothetical protein
MSNVFLNILELPPKDDAEGAHIHHPFFVPGLTVPEFDLLLSAVGYTE